MEEKEAINMINSLNNKKDFLIANIQIQESKLQTMTMIFVSAVAGILGLLSIFPAEKLFVPFIIIFGVYIFLLILKYREIKILSKKIFCVGNLMGNIYEFDLNVDRNWIKERLRNMYKNSRNLIKNAKKERWA